ncbi:hypothetical protein ACFOJ6_07160 [Gordonia humi]|uniref:hypothetical protein n=1 Tax=Gordonia humi TaxID=686429 RepID=UPI003611377C
MADTADAGNQESLEAFVERATAFLDEHLAKRQARTAFEWGVGEDSGVKLWEEPDSEEERVRLDDARRWRRVRFDAGFGWIDGPVEHGGRRAVR